MRHASYETSRNNILTPPPAPVYNGEELAPRPHPCGMGLTPLASVPVFSALLPPLRKGGDANGSHKGLTRLGSPGAHYLRFRGGK